jgi:hypothetical protein
MRKHTGENSASVDEDYKNAAALAAMVAPFRHARLSAMKIADDPNNSARVWDNASIEELRAEVLKHLEILAPVLDLPATLVQEVRQVQENKGLLPAEQGDAE